MLHAQLPSQGCSHSQHADHGADFNAYERYALTFPNDMLVRVPNVIPPLII